MAETPECPCPVCHEPGRYMKMLSALFPYENYYQCHECKHTWKVPKGECEPAEAVPV